VAADREVIRLMADSCDVPECRRRVSISVMSASFRALADAAGLDRELEEACCCSCCRPRTYLSLRDPLPAHSTNPFASALLALPDLYGGVGDAGWQRPGCCPNCRRSPLP
jgi:ATP phosphoribosyltransferase regulatory subunit HisZ